MNVCRIRDYDDSTLGDTRHRYIAKQKFSYNTVTSPHIHFYAKSNILSICKNMRKININMKGDEKIEFYTILFATDSIYLLSFSSLINMQWRDSCIVCTKMHSYSKSLVFTDRFNTNNAIWGCFCGFSIFTLRFRSFYNYFIHLMWVPSMTV